MECLKDYIGLIQCNDQTAPDSGLYINSLPGISTELLQKISNSEKGTYDAVWDAVQKVAGLRFYTDVIGRLRKRYSLKTVRTALEFIPSGSLATPEAASAQTRGIRYKFEYAYTTFQSFTIAQAYVVADAAGSMTLRILDKHGDELYTKEVTVVQGLNRITVDRSFAVDEIYIGFDFSTIGGAASEFAQDVITGFCGACRQWGCMSCDPIIEGFTLAGDSFTDTGRNTHGVGIIGYLGCDYKSLICNNKELFASPWLFLLGAQLMSEVLSSPRISQATTVDRTKHEELRDFYQVEYEKQLDASLEGYVVNTENDCCVECAENPVHKQWLP